MSEKTPFVLAREDWVPLEMLLSCPPSPGGFVAWKIQMRGLGARYGFEPDGAEVYDLDRREILAYPAEPKS